MNMKVLLIAPITALLLGVGGASIAATSSSDGTTTGMKAESDMMQNGAAAQMGDMKPGKMNDHGMMGGGMMGGGMMGMMGSCPMMGAAGGANSKVMMQMHGEMMRAMGDIMIKYADKLEVPSSPQ
ncbi:hypothetical protein [Paracandidimonas lactea]|uniref:hypothetical protein n=1 Tax=Paracandidimonas lactea TaxID=2895524 RepID=UPI001F33BE84|nr:hypothetical protein [Paracandidimonas lactea]